ncbi:unnamed protein product [Arctia plantaginis]|uniref:Uncharacterized protein n=1 Tax=Arctia plantaginis TaxID=874455 RepID=A0A8S1BG86_ARCPL|nr:unnamed protein product [Arctia plantaginis]
MPVLLQDTDPRLPTAQRNNKLKWMDCHWTAIASEDNVFSEAIATGLEKRRFGVLRKKYSIGHQNCGEIQ